MKFSFRAIVFIAFFTWSAAPAQLAAQTAGSIEFTAQVAPTGGRPEPVRQMTFYLSRKSLEDVRAEAVQADPPPDFDKFVEGLTVSRELKSWMKKHRTVELSGTEFTKSLTPDEILDTPEFYDAYMSRNAGFKGVGFPEPKFKEKEQDKNPEKYRQQKEEYRAALKKFIAAMPESVQGMDVDLTDINPTAKWDRLVADQKQRVDNRAYEIAQRQYLAAKTDTNLEGRGIFNGVAPGTYWIGMIGDQAISGDVRLRWDVPVIVAGGQTARVELNNLNGTKPYQTAKNTNP